MLREAPRRASRAALRLLGILTLGVTACEPITQLEPAPEATAYRVAYVIDGDTIEVTDSEGESQRVRLLGINTPEVAQEDKAGQCGGEAAAARMEELLPEGAAVQLLSDPRADDEDRYGRLLRYVETEEGADLGATLVADGYAYAWAPANEQTPERMGEYEAATAAARDARAGAWADCPDLGESR